VSLDLFIDHSSHSKLLKRIHTSLFDLEPRVNLTQHKKTQKIAQFTLSCLPSSGWHGEKQV